jgi:F-type H+-transporting ATPase subunit b
MNQILEQLEINQTFFYQFVLFGFFFFVLSLVYMKPIQGLIEKRNHKLKDDLASSEELLKSIETRVAEYEGSLAKARLDAIKEYESTLAKVRSEEDARIQQIRDEIKKDYLKLANELQEEKLKVESELKMQLGPMSDSLVQKVMAGP